MKSHWKTWSNQWPLKNIKLNYFIWKTYNVENVSFIPLVWSPHKNIFSDMEKFVKIFYFFNEKWNNLWTKSWMNMKFQLSLDLIILQSLEFQFFKKVVILWLQRKICCSAWLAIKNTVEKLMKFYLNENKA